MLYKTEQALSTALKGGTVEKIYLLYGQDEYLKERYATLIVDKALGGADRTFNYQRFDGKRLSLDALYDSVLTLPMLAERRVILVDDLEVDKLVAADIKKLHQILEEVEEGAVVLFLMRQSPFLPKKSAKCRNLLELVEKRGGAIELGGRSGSDLLRFLKAHFERAGCQVETEELRFLISRAGEEMLPLTREADKLAAYAGPGGRVTREAIAALVPGAVEAEVFDLSKAILRLDYQGAMTILEKLRYLREPEGNILYTLSMAFVDLYRAKAARHSGVEVAQVVGAFDYKGRDFRVKNAMRDCAKISLTALKSALELLSTCDYQLKSARTDPQVLLQQTVTGIFLTLEREGRR